MKQEEVKYAIFPLTIVLAQKYAKEIVKALDQIPVVSKHTDTQLLSESKGDRPLFGKWEHSIIFLSENNDFIGVAIGYERANEGNERYPFNCIYLNDFAISAEYQKKGLGKVLLQSWLDHNRHLGFMHFKTKLYFAVQTNSAEWNKHVQNLYLKVGFKKIAEKIYENRIDNVYYLD